MFCSNCGKNLPEGARFCEYCGAPVKAATQPVYQQQPAPNPIPLQKKKSGAGKVVAIILSIVLVLGITAAIVFFLFPSNARRVRRYTEAGNRYLTELDYEQAITSFEEALKIDPRNADALLGLAKSHEGYANVLYYEAGDVEKAGEQVAKGLDVCERALEYNVGHQRDFQRIQNDLLTLIGQDADPLAGGEEEMSEELASDETLPIGEVAPRLDGVISRINYYDKDGVLQYYESYAYYDNRLLCSITMYAVEYYDYGDGPYTYKSSRYTTIYLYDKDGTEQNTVIAPLYSTFYGDGSDQGEYNLGYRYNDDGSSEKIVIYPGYESIEQEKFGVDPTKTETVYDNAPVISTNQKNTRWAQTYLQECFNEDVETDATECRFIYVNDDEIPELFIDYTYGYAGARIFTAGNGTTDGFYFDHGYARWHEFGNMVFAAGGHMDIYYESVYKVEDGKFIVLFTGDYGAEDNANLTFDENGSVVYDYYYDGEKVTYEEYQRRVTALFPPEKAADNNENVYTYEQCKLLLEQINLFSGY